MAQTRKPLWSAKICFTGLPFPELESQSQQALTLGATLPLSNQLTNLVTHLIVADVSSAKYAHVARSRPDILVLNATYIPAVHARWAATKKRGASYTDLEFSHKIKPLEGVRVALISLGAEEFTARAVRADDMLKWMAVRNGAKWGFDLEGYATHVIARADPVRVYEKYALHESMRSVGTRTVRPEWLIDVNEMQLRVDEDVYDPSVDNLEVERREPPWNMWEIRVMGEMNEEDKSVADVMRRLPRRDRRDLVAYREALRTFLMVKTRIEKYD